MVPRGVLFVLLSLCAAAAASAQSDPGLLPSRAIVLPAPFLLGDLGTDEIAALRRWTRDYDDWSAWFSRWRSRVQPGVFSARARRKPPVPPDWLPGACLSRAAAGVDALADACRAWREWSGDDAAEAMRQQAAQARSRHEAPRKTAWWEHVHADGLWAATRSDAPAFGIAGMHTTMHVSKRFQVFMAPGAILMRVPSLRGDMTWTAATDWGVSYGLFDVKLPASRPATVHFNMVRVWVLGENAIRMSGDLYLAGFSVSFKPR